MSTPDPPASDPTTEATAGQALDRALPGSGTVQVEHEDARVQAEVEASGPVGVRLKGLDVHPKTDGPVDLHARARDLAERLRPGGERLRAVEIDPGLGGGNLRTDPRDLRGGRYFQVDVETTGRARVRRIAVDPDSGERTDTPFDLTRRQLEDLVDGLVQLPSEEDE